MRFVTYTFRSKTQLGMMIDEDQIIDLQAVSKRYLPGSTASYLDSMQAFIEAGAKAVTMAKKAAKYVEGLDSKGIRRLAQAGLLVKRNRTRLLSPIPVPRKNVICLGVNYQEHIDEGVRARGVQLNTPEVPVFFTKPATAVIGDQGRVLAHSATDKIDWEVELAVVIGPKGPQHPPRQGQRLHLRLHRLPGHDRPGPAAPAPPVVEGQVSGHLLPAGTQHRAQKRHARPEERPAPVPCQR